MINEKKQFKDFNKILKKFKEIKKSIKELNKSLEEFEFLYIVDYSRKNTYQPYIPEEEISESQKTEKNEELIESVNKSVKISPTNDIPSYIDKRPLTPFIWPTPIPSPIIPVRPEDIKSHCPKCGIELHSNMMYVCSQTECPTGLGSPSYNKNIVID